MPDNNEIIRSVNNELIHDKKLEQKVLALVLNNQKISHQIIPYLMEDDFYVYEHKNLFVVLKTLYDETASINDQSITEKAWAKGLKNVNQSLLNEIYTASAFEANVQSYLDNIIRLSKLRQIQKKTVNIVNKFNSNTSQNISDDEIINDLQELLINIDRKSVSENFLTSEKVSDEYYRNLQKRRNSKNEINGLATGYTLFDNLNQGLQPTELIILAARPAMGKTAFALNIALNVAKYAPIKDGIDNNKNVAFFSLEMSPEQLMGRIYGATTNIPASKLKEAKFLTDHEILKIQNLKLHQIDKLNLFIDDSGTTTLNTLIWKCRRLHKIKPLDLIVIDYLQLINVDNKSRGDSRQNEVATISRSLKLLAKELNIPIIALSQLSRDVEKRENKKPMLADLRESGAIEQDADIVMFLYRENYYKKAKKVETNPSEMYNSEPTIVDLIVAKNRSGSNAEIKLLFDMPTGRFENIDWDQINRYNKISSEENN
ncbi:replicative DNA helicase [Mycoplasmopsis columbina]|uniref:replicative DNA helicase n=1 Tax=Mycoplasmopsis columbina TaxID=114881 RepID=UPI0004A77CA8|nr:replicative DNA helicase [Mycoplasmopsis columbina]VEU77026.1 Replicative DNA helicase [Mycoplasmopsis columbina]